MKKHWNMTGNSFGMAFDVAAGGGVAAPAAPAAAAPAPTAAPTAPAAAAPAPTRGGYFGGLKRAAVVTEPETPAAEPAVTPAPTETPKPAESAPEPVKAPETPAAPAPVTVPESLTRPFLGRVDVKTQAEAEQLYIRSQKEAIRLFEDGKAKDAKIVDFEAKMAGIQKELELARKTPAQPELDEAQLNELFKENPAKAAQYMQDRQERVKAFQAEKETAEKSVREKHETDRRIARQTSETWDSMLKDAKTYPKFQDLVPRIDEIYAASVVNGKSPFDSNPEAPKMLWRLALGEVYEKLLSKGVEVKADAAETARLKADADAASSRAAAGGGSATVDSRTQAQKADDAWREKMRSTSPDKVGSRIFKERKAT